MSSVYKFKTRPPSQASAKARLFWLICYLSFPHVLSDLESSEPGSVENYDISMDSMEDGWKFEHLGILELTRGYSEVTLCHIVSIIIFPIWLFHERSVLALKSYSASLWIWLHMGGASLILGIIERHCNDANSRTQELGNAIWLSTKTNTLSLLYQFHFHVQLSPKNISLLFAIVPLTPVSPFNYHNSLFGISFVNWIALKQ